MFMKTMTSLHIRQEKIVAKKERIVKILKQKAGKEDFRTLKEEVNQLLKGQMRLAEFTGTG